MESEISTGIILGLTYAATPGAVNVETIRQGLQHGVQGSLAVQLGSTVGRIVFSLLAFSGAGLLLQSNQLQLASGALGAVLLVYLGISTIRTARASPAAVQPKPSEGLSGRAFWTGAALSIANPLAIIFWLALSGGMLGDPTMNSSVFLAGFLAGGLLISLIVAVLAAWGRSFLTVRATPAVAWTCGLVLIAFGLKLGLSLGQPLVVW